MFVATLEGPFAFLALCRPQEVKCDWNKGTTIWFRERSRPSCRAVSTRELTWLCVCSASTLGLPVLDNSIRSRCTGRRDLYEARLSPREGDERLSAKNRSESDDGAHAKRSKKPPLDKSNKKQRSTDLGRALRTIYDDTLRESVPDDFLNLIGKLS
jgi:hypothetical protein